ncbi:glucosidase II beta subunit-like protein domain-containing protein [Trichoderma breve]|uniref:Endoplasmic reticulum lectin n=1 Tax=Trichoderma breve TaxID=2034170 RepID=A0A9W9E7T8_9HYPO|nr:glucosidase II beta subunit-like protein domain-containing protein [Trichoderma breve]KAJ4859732.1 glucosidase II beta subunit-like protein domain-containing protein [Trichoderma breve]
MRRLQLSLLAALPLCRAKSRAFSIHEDLLAYPQFEVVFSDHFISEQDAQSLLEYNIEHPTYSAEFSQPTISDASGNQGHQDGRYRGGLPLTYEVMNMPPHRYLCAIPIIEPPSPENQTATELAKAEEERELDRAAISGWNLLSQLEDTCLYFMSGWWSYRFCNNREIVQFHALPSTPMGKPPQRDPHAAQYILGQASLPDGSDLDAESSSGETKSPAELQVKGDQRYLVQKLEGGTICDLTGRPRTIEVQYHCVPGMQNDKIGWIKEVTICAYVMVVNTPRLCGDVAFLPPEESKADAITCQLITDDEKQAPPLLDQQASKYLQEDELIEQEEELLATDGGQLKVGGVLVGGRKSLSAGDQDGQPPMVLAPPRNYINTQQAAEQLIEVLIKAASKQDGGQVDRLSKEKLEKLNLSPDMVDQWEQEMMERAGDKGWQLEIVGDVDDAQRHLRGWMHEDEEDDDGGLADQQATAAKGAKEKGNVKTETTKAAEKKKKKSGGKKDDEGSEEQFFKEEL